MTDPIQWRMGGSPARAKASIIPGSAASLAYTSCRVAASRSMSASLKPMKRWSPW